MAPARPRVPVVVVAALDGVLRDSAVFGLLVDAPGTVVLQAACIGNLLEPAGTTPTYTLTLN